MRKRLRSFSVLLAVLGASATAAYAQTYPDRPITLVVGFSPGGSTDALARMAADDFSKAIGQPIIIENRPGAAGFVAFNHVAGAAPDGYTLLFSENALPIGTALSPDRGFDPTKKFTPIALIARAPTVLIASKSLEANTLPELIALSKAKPGSLSFSSSGIGAVSHMTFEALRGAAGIDAVHVPYKGGGDALAAVASGVVQLNLTTPHISKQMVDTGKAKALVATSTERLPIMPDVPTLKETGISSDVQLGFWFAVFGPAGLPEPVVAKWNKVISETLAKPEFKEKLAKSNITPAYGDSKELGTLLASEVANWTKFIDKANLRTQQ
jgi:tripartite-type tricarboxylate transporter receptor subunit TctC